MSLGAANTVAAATQSISSPATNAGATNGAPERQPDRVEAETAPQFGELLQNIQSKYGAKPEKGREIKKTLGKDDFLRIMITQMKNQDPTNPFKAEQMAAEMAQFTTVEQLKNMNETLTKMTTANQPLERMAMTGMIGKTITVDRGRFPHQEGVADQLSFGLPRDAASVTVALLDEHGETVLSKDLGKLKAGENQFNWDGKKVNTLPAKSGNYMIRVDATDDQGHKLDTASTAQAKVIGISFEGQEAVFLIGDNKRQEKVTMKNIVRIDDNGPGAFGGGAGASGAGAGGNPGIVSGSGAPKAPPAFFTFEKGVGSKNLDSTQVSAETQKAIASYQSNGREVSQPGGPGARGAGEAAGSAAAGAAPTPQQAHQAAMAGAPGERGFPNGLQDDSSSNSEVSKGGDKK